jgi:hypothetical protein
MPQIGGRIGDFQPAEFLRAPRNVSTNLEDPVHMALGINPARQGQPDQIEARGNESTLLVILSEHDATNLARPDTPRQIELAGECVSRELVGRDVGE